ncbi:hypothetical protein AVEN_20327-1 [Araneus ventricosus]|uniref:Uncharacterized protein n=1 Tax=Araneus ventricosus TaxID=182803 RepID=A0A4Y2IP05_ARAVE|nr:hypothetical protein AVEN_20327-1 [Araneus ventricosus]
MIIPNLGFHGDNIMVLRHVKTPSAMTGPVHNLRGGNKTNKSLTDENESDAHINSYTKIRKSFKNIFPDTVASHEVESLVTFTNLGVLNIRLYTVVPRDTSAVEQRSFVLKYERHLRYEERPAATLHTAHPVYCARALSSSQQHSRVLQEIGFEEEPEVEDTISTSEIKEISGM